MKKFLLIGLFSVIISGCASIYTQTHNAYDQAVTDSCDPHTIPNIYSGFMLDISFMSAENAGFFFFMDIPLSLTVDTVFLPYTVYRQINYGNWYDPKICKEKNKQPG